MSESTLFRSGLVLFAVAGCLAGGPDYRVIHVKRPLAVNAAGNGAAGNGAVAKTTTTYATIPTWQASDGTYSYEMVGVSPLLAQTTQSTTIATPVVPIILTFSDGTVFNPTVSNSCSSASATSLVLSSPLFGNSAYTVGGTSVGTTQYEDFFQRANFWQYTGPSGINPNYHVLLTGTQAAAISITVPAASGQTVAAPCGRLGEMSINWFDSYLQSTVFAQLASAGIPPSSLPIFLLNDVVMYQTTAAASCCIMGYHSAFNNPNYASTMQTYAVADFDTTGNFANESDVADLTHEVGEWMNDPTGNNPVPAWGHVGQVTGCQANLEAGDPLTGTTVPVTMSNSYTYHVQELAFKSWFYRDSASSGVNGWYSSNGTFKTPSTPCYTSVTTLTVSPTSLAVGAAATIAITVGPGSGFSGTPAGTVSLVSSLSTTPIATYTLSSGSASGTITTLPAGTYTLTAEYLGGGSFEASSSTAVSVTVTGTPQAKLSASALTFASTNVGSSSTAQTVTLSNPGTGPLTVSSISLTGTNSGDYSQTNTCGSSVAVSGSCTISITFKPTAAGTRTATLSVADAAKGSPQTVSLTGTAVAVPVVSLSSASLTFASTTVGSSAATQAITLKNTGTASLTSVAVSLTGTNSGDYSQTNTCGTSVAAAGSCTITVTFKPTAAGTRTASVSIADNATGSPQTVALTGTAVAAAPAVTLSPTSLAFASTTVGASSATQAVTLTNSGTASLTSVAISLTGTNSGDYSQTNTCGTSVAAAGSCTITVTFKPTAAGTRAASVSIADNATGSPQTLAVTGTAVAAVPTVTLSPTSLTFASTTVGTAATSQTVTITNSGTASLTGIAVSLTGTASGDFSETTTCAATLAAKAACTVSVGFKPTAKGTRTASLSIADNATGSPQTVSLSGTGK